MTDDDFLARFEAGSLEHFSHEDHLRTAFAYARRGGVEGAVKGARRIRELAAKLGAPGKYHETLTVAWARVVGHHATEDESFGEFLRRQPQLLRRDLMSAHYSSERLFSEEARASFVEPDLLPLP